MIYWISHFIFVAISKLFFPVRVKGLHHIPAKGSFILASNHLSNLDPMLLGIASRRKLSYIAKESLFKNKFFGFFLRKVNAFPIKRDSLDIGAIKEALKRLRNSSPIVIFPEGTRTQTVEIKEPQPGIGLLAVKANVAVVPTLIDGSDKVLAPGQKMLRPGAITVSFAPPIFCSTQDSYPQIASRIMQEIYNLRSAR